MIYRRARAGRHCHWRHARRDGCIRSRIGHHRHGLGGNAVLRGCRYFLMLLQIDAISLDLSRIIVGDTAAGTAAGRIVGVVVTGMGTGKHFRHHNDCNRDQHRSSNQTFFQFSIHSDQYTSINELLIESASLSKPGKRWAHCQERTTHQNSVARHRIINGNFTRSIHVIQRCNNVDTTLLQFFSHLHR